MTTQSMKYCKTCGKQTLHVSPSTAHVLHLLLSIITFGLWIIVWIIAAANNSSQSSCTQCGRFTGVFGSGTKGIATGPSPETHLKCPDCKELVLKEANVCKHCGCRLIPA